jgi:hypothetical protein
MGISPKLGCEWEYIPSEGIDGPFIITYRWFIYYINIMVFHSYVKFSVAMLNDKKWVNMLNFWDDYISPII